MQNEEEIRNTDCIYFAKKKCNTKECLFRHNIKALHSGRICPLWTRNECKNRDCELMHPTKKKDYIRRRLCKFFRSPGGCRKGDECKFLHHEVPEEASNLPGNGNPNNGNVNGQVTGMVPIVNINRNNLPGQRRVRKNGFHRSNHRYDRKYEDSVYVPKKIMRSQRYNHQNQHHYRHRHRPIRNQNHSGNWNNGGRRKYDNNEDFVKINYYKSYISMEGKGIVEQYERGSNIYHRGHYFQPPHHPNLEYGYKKGVHQEQQQQQHQDHNSQHQHQQQPHQYYPPNYLQSQKQHQRPTHNPQPPALPPQPEQQFYEFHQVGSYHPNAYQHPHYSQMMYPPQNYTQQGYYPHHQPQQHQHQHHHQQQHPGAFINNGEGNNSSVGEGEETWSGDSSPSTDSMNSQDTEEEKKEGDEKDGTIQEGEGEEDGIQKKGEPEVNENQEVVVVE